MRPKTERQGRLDDTAAPALCFWVCFLREEGVGRLLQFFSLLTVGLLVCIDQLIKIIIKLWLEPLQNVPVIPNVLHLIYVENTGAAFGVLKGSAVVMGVLSSVIFIAGIYLIVSKKLNTAFSQNKFDIGLSYATVIFILSGGLGNFVDRIFRHYVVDFIAPVFINFPVFNFADCLITVGLVLFIIWVARYCLEIKRLEAQEKQQAELKRRQQNQAAKQDD